MLNFTNILKNDDLEQFKQYLKEEQVPIIPEQSLEQYIQHRSIHIISYLLDNGVNPVHPYQSYLKLSAIYGAVELVQLFLERGVDIHQNEDEALVWATYNHHTDVVKYLVEQGADVFAKGQMCLQYAAMHDNIELLDYFLAQGCDPNIAKKHVGELGEIYFKNKDFSDKLNTDLPEKDIVTKKKKI